MRKSILVDESLHDKLSKYSSENNIPIVRIIEIMFHDYTNKERKIDQGIFLEICSYVNLNKQIVLKFVKNCLNRDIDFFGYSNESLILKQVMSNDFCDVLEDSFDWDLSPEGYRFWSDIFNNYNSNEKNKIS